MKRAIALLALSLAACRPSTASAAPELRVLSWCDLPGVRCQELDDAPEGIVAELLPLNWCCGYDGTPCVPVEMVMGCDAEGEYAVICDWGRSLPDGSIDCYD